jgi:hypothetical protein
LIRGKLDFWRGPTQILKKKTLILADWRAPSWSLKKIATVREAASQWIQDGFTVYLWQNGHLEPLKKESLYLLTDDDVRKAMTPAFENDIKQIASIEHRLSHDQIEVIDDHHLDSLLDPKQPIDRPRQLRLSEANCLDEKLQIGLLDIVRKLNLPLLNFVNDCYSRQLYSLTNMSSSRYPQAKLLNTALLVDSETEIKNEKLSGDYKIEKLCFNTNKTDLINNLLNKYISVSALTIYGDITSIKLEHTLNNLEELQLKSTSYDKSINAFLEHIPHLKKLWMSNDVFLSEGLNEDIIEELEELCLITNAHIEGDLLKKFTSKAPKLKRLDITSNKINIMDTINFPFLERLEIICDIASINLFLHANLQLKEIIIAGFLYTKHSEERITLPPLAFAHLEILTLSTLNEEELMGADSIHSMDLMTFILAAPKLKKLDFFYISEPEQKINLPPSALMELEELTLRGKINVEDLYHFIKAAPHLKKLKLASTIYFAIDLQKLKKHLKSSVNVIALNTRESSKNIQFDPEEMKEYKPRNIPFVFKNLNSKAQGMIIDKTSKYLTIKDEDLDDIPKIQNGICMALACLFIEMNPTVEEWNEFLKPIQDWNGKKKLLKSDLIAKFEFIYKKIKQYQFTSKHSRYYLGDNLHLLLNERKPFVLGNPWHAVGVAPLKEKDQWIFYEPNFFEGPINVLQDNLLALIKKYEGTVISVLLPQDEDIPCITPVINDSDEFIKNGGLFVLSRAVNKKNLLKILLEENADLSHRALDGLLLRNTKNIPAWVKVHENQDKDISLYGSRLIQRFIQHNGIKPLLASIEHLSFFRKTKIRLFLQSLSPISIEKKEIEHKFDSSIKPLVESISTRKKQYEKLLATWEKPIAEPVLKLKYYAQKVISEAKDASYLIKLESDGAVQAIALALQQYCLSTERPVFYVDSPDDLICSARWIETTNKDGKITGNVREGPGGPLYQFLEKNREKKPIIIVNYNNFTASDLAKFNTLLDDYNPEAKKEPTVDTVPLGQNTRVIGLININKPDCYQGADFYGRFQEKEICSVVKTKLEPPPLPITSEEKRTCVVELYNAFDWKEQLLGSWKIKKDQLVFEKGVLPLDLTDEDVIEIRNGPWDDPSFQHFWQQVQLKGEIHYANQIFTIPKNLRLIQKEKGYEWKEKSNSISFCEELVFDPPICVLNRHLMNDFLNQYQCDTNEKTLDTIEGWIEKTKKEKKSELHLNITSELNDDEWAKLLDHAALHQIKLIAHYSKDLTLPKWGQVLESKQEEKKEEKPIILPSHTRLIHSNDSDVSAMQVINQSQSKEKWKVIDISECTSSDLLKHIDGQWDEKAYRFRFTESERALLKALKANDNDNVILKGKFSSELIDSLTPLLLQRVGNEKALGQLVLLTHDTADFRFLPCEKHTISASDKRSYLKNKNLSDLKSIENFIETESASQLQARLIQPNHDPWIGIRSLPRPAPIERKIHLSESKAIAEKVINGRLDSINGLLDRAPYAYITGLTGVGKSTFIQSDFLNDLKSKDPPGKLYQSISQIKEWAKDHKTEGRKILFLDEANLSGRQWSEFEGLFHDPPGILIDGEYYPLTSQNKVIFSGNPLSYGDEREPSPFFERHGNAILFDSLPPEFIYHSTLKPIFSKSSIDIRSQEEISLYILKLYQFLTNHSTTEVLISPRELQMIALMTATFLETNVDTKPIDVVSHYVYTIGKTLIPDFLKTQFEKEFQKTSPLVRAEKKEVKTDFLMTPSRQSACNLLDDLLRLREWRREGKKTEAQCYGGLGGLIFEGVPAAGKSELTIHRLVASGFKEKKWLPSPVSYPIGYRHVAMLKQTPQLEDLKPDTIAMILENEQLTAFWVQDNKIKTQSFSEWVVPDIVKNLPNHGETSDDIKLIKNITSQYGCTNESKNIFYKMPVSMSLQDKEKLLLQAFDEGAIVVIDEINSSPMMEELLNPLLMGKTKEGVPPKHPGFMIIGTQNPITMAGRRGTSPALTKRMIREVIPPYPKEELEKILIHKGIDEYQAIDLTAAYETQLQKAACEKLNPAPTLRDLFQASKKLSQLEDENRRMLHEKLQELKLTFANILGFEEKELKKLPESIQNISFAYLNENTGDINHALERNKWRHLVVMLARMPIKELAQLNQEQFKHLVKNQEKLTIALKYYYGREKISAESFNKMINNSALGKVLSAPSSIWGELGFYASRYKVNGKSVTKAVYDLHNDLVTYPQHKNIAAVIKH